jgi:hypothetical protein
MMDGNMGRGVLDLAGGEHGLWVSRECTTVCTYGLCVVVTNSGVVQNKFLVMRCLLYL